MCTGSFVTVYSRVGYITDNSGEYDRTIAVSLYNRIIKKTMKQNENWFILVSITSRYKEDRCQTFSDVEIESDDWNGTKMHRHFKYEVFWNGAKYVISANYKLILMLNLYPRANVFVLPEHILVFPKWCLCHWLNMVQASLCKINTLIYGSTCERRTS